MNEALAQAHIARLRRIWKPKHEIHDGLHWAKPWEAGEEGYISGRIVVDDGIQVLFGQTDLSLRGHIRGQGTIGVIFCSLKLGRILEVPHDPDLGPPVIAKWLPFFRRNCWLSGAPLEATAHEKLEWIQGFTAQEIEAWKLHF